MNMTDCDAVYCPSHNEWYLYQQGEYVAAFNTLSSLEAYCSEKEPDDLDG
jgi:hypothetical protein